MKVIQGAGGGEQEGVAASRGKPWSPCRRSRCTPETLTFEHVAAHHREAAAVHQVAHGHVPAHGPVDARVAGPHTFQGVDGHIGAPLDHSYSDSLLLL